MDLAENMVAISCPALVALDFELNGLLKLLTCQRKLAFGHPHPAQMLKRVDCSKLARRLAVERQRPRQVFARVSEASAEVVLIANVFVRCRELHLFPGAL